MEIEAATGAFFSKFSELEMNGVGLALRALSKDDVYAAQADNLLGLEARLTLVERLAFARDIPIALMTELKELLSRARSLRDQRDHVAVAQVSPMSQYEPAESGPIRKSTHAADFARLAEVGASWTPPLAQIEAYVTEATELQRDFRLLAEKLNTFLAHRLGPPAR